MTNPLDHPAALKRIWTVTQVGNLYKRQAEAALHPYTCGCGCKLWPRLDGWWCADCSEVVQTSAHQIDLDGGMIGYTEKLKAVFKK